MLIFHRSLIAMLSVLGHITLSPISQSYAQEAEKIEGVEAATTTPEPGEWTSYGRDAGGTRFSPLMQINLENVSELEVAWRYRVSPKRSLDSFEVTPLKIGESLYLCTSRSKVIALDAETGEEKWVFDPEIGADRPVRACRGVSYYRNLKQTGLCVDRILTGTAGAGLWALDAHTGRPCPDFGDGGRVDLMEGMGDHEEGYYFVTSPPAIVGGKAVVGGWVTDNQKVGEPSGVVRAFDAVTGDFAWAWDIGRPGIHTQPPRGETYTPGTPNSWAPMSVDESLGLVYVPTGNATPDYVGMHRSEQDDKYASSVVALDAETGDVRWSFQTVHHDVWDYDVASQPTLIDIPGPDGVVPALIQPTKTGQLFLLDRRNGEPLAEVEEKPVPQGGIPGEPLSSTQPFSIGMPSLVGPPLSEDDMWGLTPLDQLWCRIQFKRMRYDGPFTPPGEGTSLFYPGYLGGVDWGSSAFDPERSILIVNSNRMPVILNLIARKEADRLGLKPSPILDKEMNPQAGTPYASNVRMFVSPLLKVPCTQPPYGMLTAIDLKTRKVLWEKPLGTAREIGPFGIGSGLPFVIGAPNTGGSVLTRSGLVFIAAVEEDVIRAFNIETGEEAWQHALSGPGQATPMTYRSSRSGRQFVVISSGGNLNFRETYKDVFAFALPN